MNKYKLHKLLSNMVDGIERDKLGVKAVMQILATELKDPFASEIDEFLIEKAEKQHPQEEAVEELEEESLDYKEPTEQEHPQEEAVDELKEEAVDYKEPTEQEHPQEETKEKVIDEIKDTKKEEKEEIEGTEESIEESIEEDELEAIRAKQDALEKRMDELRDKKDAQIESALKKLSDEIAQRGYKKIANRFILAASNGVVDILNSLLMGEFQIRDILENYTYLFSPEDAKKAAQHKPKESVLYLQKQIISFGSNPTTQRLTIPAINPSKAEGVMALVKAHENKLLSDYMAAVKAIENEEKYFTLKVMFERIILIKSQIRDGV